MDFQEIEGKRKGSVVFRDENGFEYSKNTANMIKLTLVSQYVQEKVMYHLKPPSLTINGVL
jgi:hypothetical protein